jgi:hypothetical protein
LLADAITPSIARTASVTCELHSGALSNVELDTTRELPGAIPIISDVEGFRAYYVVCAPDDTVTAISVFNNYAGAKESNRRALAWIERNLTPLLDGPATAMAGGNNAGPISPYG